MPEIDSIWTYRCGRRLALNTADFQHSERLYLPLLCMWGLTSRDVYLNAVTLHSSLCLHGDCVRYVHNCLGLWDVFFSMVVLSYDISTNDFNFVIGIWFSVAVAVL